jgi:hypothetical protein
MIIDRVACAAVVFSVVVAFLGSPDAHAQSRGTAGDCLAFADSLGVPVAVMVTSTNGMAPDGSMTFLQLHLNGYLDHPWIIQPGGPQTLMIKQYDHSTRYLVSANGGFSVLVTPIPAAADPRFAVMDPRLAKINWTFHPEMTEGGNCKGAWVGSVGS